MAQEIDYAGSGLDIQAAMVDQVRRFPDKRMRPAFLLWDGVHVRTADAIHVPQEGMVTATVVSVESDVRQGFDLKFDDGWLELADGERVPLLRTWRDRRYEDTVTYPFVSRDGLLWFWNVFERTWPDDAVTEEKWTGNAGFWVERPEEYRRVYHCSHGLGERPDFGALIVEIRIEPLRKR